MIQGNAQSDIFQDKSDKEKLLEIVKRVLDDNLISLYAYCIMNNHGHFIIQEQSEDISNVMKRINVAYAVYYNKKYDSRGQVFYDRFKSEAIEDHKKLLQMIRFVHNNPVKSGYVNRQCDYPWSSYNEYLKDSREKFINQDTILMLFSSQRKEALKKFIVYMVEETGEIFLDLEESVERSVVLEIDKYLKKNHIDLNQLGYKENIAHRNKVILLARNMGGFSIRRIAELLNLNRGTVYKVIAGSRENNDRRE
nr:transposase [Alkalibacter mobilis]